jgi:monoamine oxidase
MTFDNSPPDGTPGALVAFALADDARELERLTEEARRERVLGRLAELFGAPAERPDQFHEKCWAREQWTRGCYAGFFGPGGWTAFGDVLRRPLDRVFWASAETAVFAHGSMDGAVAAGERAAREALSRPADRGQPSRSLPAEAGPAPRRPGATRRAASRG